MEYKELLLKTAICAIAADGKIDEREIKALDHIEKNSPYFSSVDLEDALKSSLVNCMNDIESFIKSTIESISKEELNVVQELTILEISLRIISADDDIDEKEKGFIKNLRTVLKVDDLMISERFGEINYLGISAPYKSHSFEDKTGSAENFEITNE